MNIAELKKELRQRDQQIDELLETVRRQAAEIERLKEKIAGLEAALHCRAEANKSKKPRFSGDYSLSRQERERTSHKKKTSPGRRPNALKGSLIERTEDVFPDGVEPQRCCFVRDRFAWRLEDGRAVYVHYRLHKVPWHKPFTPPHVGAGGFR